MASGSSTWGQLARRIERRAVRFGRRLERWVAGSRAELVHAPLSQTLGRRVSLGRDLDVRRFERIRTYLVAEELVDDAAVLEPKAASIPLLATVHDRAYLARMQTPDSVALAFPGLPPARAGEVLQWQRRSVGGTVLATKLALQLRPDPRPVIHLGGGLHHAYADAAQGFCLFNDVAIAIRWLREARFGGQILVVDFDTHQGDGTKAIFADDPSVFTLSIHNTTVDGAPAAANLDVELGSGVADAVYLAAVRDSLERAMDRCRPDFVFYVGGVDVASTDPIGNWRVSADAIAARDQLVVDAAGSGPLVWVLAGGYGPEAWRYSARGIAALLSGVDRPIPSDAERNIRRFRRIARTLSKEELGRLDEVSDDNFGITESDILGDLATERAPERFLGFYSVYGMELAFHRYGVLEILAAQGIEDVRVEFDTGHPRGHLLRLYTDDERGDLLIELLARPTVDVNPYRLLAVEWLLLQNPRREVAADRPLLPGQAHPGLGALRPVMGMLAIAVERLDFDGLYFLPGHYHMGHMARHHMAYLDPVDEARFTAFRTAVEGLSLFEATQAIATGRVFDRRSQQAAQWLGAPMVMARNPDLNAQIQSDAYEAAVQQALGDFDFVLDGSS